MSTHTISPARECIDLTDYAEVAYRRSDLEGGCGEIWDITGPDEQSTVRICEDDGDIVIYLFTNGRAMIEHGKMTFRHALAAPTFVAAAIDQIVSDFAL